MSATTTSPSTPATMPSGGDQPVPLRAESSHSSSRGEEDKLSSAGASTSPEHNKPSEGVASLSSDEKKPHWLQTEGEHRIPDNNLWIVFPGLMLSVFLAALDQTILAVALPTIAEELQAGPAAYSLVGSLYLITASAMMPLYGRVSDITGRKPIAFFAIIVFLLGSALCGAAKTITWLCAARAVQGVGGGGIISMAQIIMSDITTLEKRAAFAGVFGFVWGLASVIGPLAGGALTDKVSWRWW